MGIRLLAARLRRDEVVEDWFVFIREIRGSNVQLFHIRIGQAQLFSRQIRMSGLGNLSTNSTNFHEWGSAYALRGYGVMKWLRTDWWFIREIRGSNVQRFHIRVGQAQLFFSGSGYVAYEVYPRIIQIFTNRERLRRGFSLSVWFVFIREIRGSNFYRFHIRVGQAQSFFSGSGYVAYEVYPRIIQIFMNRDPPTRCAATAWWSGWGLIRVYSRNLWFKTQRTTRFWRRSAYLKLSKMANLKSVMAK